jgi:hypothetical protein
VLIQHTKTLGMEDAEIRMQLGISELTPCLTKAWC